MMKRAIETLRTPRARRRLLVALCLGWLLWRLWGGQTPTRVWHWPGYTTEQVVCSADGATIAVVLIPNERPANVDTMFARVIVAEQSTGAVRWQANLPIFSVAMPPDGSLLAVGGVGNVTVRRGSDGSVVWRQAFDRTKASPQRWVFRDDGAVLAGLQGNTPWVYDSASGAPVPADAFVWSPSTRAFVVSPNGIDLSEAERLRLRPAHPFGFPLFDLAYSPDVTRIAVANAEPARPGSWFPILDFDELWPNWPNEILIQEATTAQPRQRLALPDARTWVQDLTWCGEQTIVAVADDTAYTWTVPPYQPTLRPSWLPSWLPW